jgi:hypothetical protein
MGWLHRLLHPHCEHCIEQQRCDACEVLREELAIAHRVNQSLLDKLTAMDKPVANDSEDGEAKPVLPKVVPWSVRRAELEREDMLKADRLKADELIEEFSIDSGDDIEKLEKEVGLNA